MEAHALFVIGLTIAAFLSFALERVTVETTALAVMVILLAAFTVAPLELADGSTFRPTLLLAGFGHEALVAICALMILGRGLLVTGALEPAARALSQLWIRRPQAARLLLLCGCVLVSGFINDTPIVVVMLPILISVSTRLNQPPSRTLMPMNFAVLIGGMGTTIGTSTNLLVVAIATQLGVREIGMFDFVHLTALAALVGILYLWLILPRLLPDRVKLGPTSAPRVYEAHLRVVEGSRAIGRSVAQIQSMAGPDLEVLAVLHGSDVRIARLAQRVLRVGDEVHVRDTTENLKRVEQELGLRLHDVQSESDMAQQVVAEVLLTEQSTLCGKSLRQLHLSDHHGVVAIGLRRSEDPFRRGPRLSETPLSAGDILLLQGSVGAIDSLRADSGLIVLGGPLELPRVHHSKRALTIMACVILTAALKLAPIAVASLTGVLAMLLSRCIDWRDVTRALNVRVVLLVASSLALGSALIVTGGAEILAQAFARLTSHLAPAVTLSLLMLAVAVVTNFVSNNAAAAVGTPIAVTIASELGVAPEPFVLAVLFGANLSYVTPMAYQTNLLIMSAAGYRFSDFVRGGLPLLVLMWLAYSALLPWFYPLTPA